MKHESAVQAGNLIIAVTKCVVENQWGYNVYRSDYSKFDSGLVSAGDTDADVVCSLIIDRLVESGDLDSHARFLRRNYSALEERIKVFAA